MKPVDIALIVAEYSAYITGLLAGITGDREAGAFFLVLACYARLQRKLEGKT